MADDTHNKELKDEKKTILVTTEDGTVHKKTFQAPHGTVYSVSYESDNETSEDKKSKVFINATNKSKLVRDVTIKSFVPDDKQDKFLITILQKPHQTIVAYGITINENGEKVYSGESYTQSFFAEHGSIWRFSVIPDKKFGDYYLNILQSDHQLITVRAMTGYHDYRAGVLVSYPHDDRLTSYPEFDDDKYEYTVSHQNCRVFATLPIDSGKNGTIHRVQIIQVPHHSITLVDEDGVAYTSNAFLRTGIKYTITSTPDKGYNPANIVINSVDQKRTVVNGTLNNDIIVTAINSSMASTEIKMTPQVFDISRLSKRNHDSIAKFAEGPYSSKLKPLDVYLYQKIKPYNYTTKLGYKEDLTTHQLVNSAKIEKDDELPDNYRFKLSTDISYESSETRYIENMIHTWYGLEYFVGYMRELTNSELDTNLAPIQNGIPGDHAKIRVLGYSLKDNDPTDKKVDIDRFTLGKWIIGLEHITTKGNNILDIIPDLKLAFYSDDNKLIKAEMGGFKYVQSFSFNNQNKNHMVAVFTKDANKGPVDPMYIYMMQHINRILNLRIGVYKQ